MQSSEPQSTERPLPASVDAVPPPPRRPSRRAERLIFAYQGGQKAMLIVGIILLPVGLLFAAVFSWGVATDLSIARSPQHVAGEVLSAELDESVEINGEHPTVVRFRYSVDGEEYRGESSTRDDALIAAAQPGNRVDLEVAKSDPQASRLAGTTHATFGYAGLFSLVMPAIGALLLVLAIRSNRREMRAFTSGRPARARVAFAGPDTSMKINGRHPYKVEWEFKVGDEVYQGSISNMSQLALEDLLAAKELVVVYDPDDPSCNTVYVP